MKHVIGLSGGMDSATLLGYLLNKTETEQVFCCLFHYGSKHNNWEIAAAIKVVKHYQALYGQRKVVSTIIDVQSAFDNISSNLMLTGGKIPEGHYEAESMKSTVVPGRNLIFASIMAGIAESIGATVVALGVHSGDHHIYPDCRPTFINATYRVVQESSEYKVRVLAPFLNANKGEILHIGLGLTHQVPYELTRTCYTSNEVSCGKCGSCVERLEAFENIGKIDPIAYKEK